MNIVLIGFKNSGKTTVGKALAQKLQRVFIDTDGLIQQAYLAKQHTMRTVREIFQQHGETYLRELEKECIKLLTDENAIIATGGGSILDLENSDNLKKYGKLIYLSATYKALSNRTSTYLGKDFSHIYAQRKNIYPKIADVCIATENKSVTEIVDEIIQILTT